MEKTNIVKNNVVVQSVIFEDEQTKQNWLATLEKDHAWGKPEGFYLLNELTPEELAQEIERKTQDDLGNDLLVPLIKIPAQYQVVIEDISAEIEAQKKVQAAMTAQQLGNSIICKVWAINDAKNLDLAQMQALFSDANLTAIERCLRNGALQTAKALIQSLDTTFFTTEEKQTILDLFV